MTSALRMALIQLRVSADKTANIQRAVRLIEEACNSERKPTLLCLPECFNTPYGHKFFKPYAEQIPGGETTEAMVNASKKHGIHIIAGSIPEIAGDKVLNTSVVFSPSGAIIGKFSKMHLFDIDIPGQFTFMESESLSAGDKLLHFDVPVGPSGVDKFRVGVGICYDLRFPELSLIYANKFGCNLLVFPGAFSTTTGPAHWELLCRARALDTQSYVAVCSPACDPDAEYVSHAESMICGPWGDVLGNAGKDEKVLYADLSLAEVNRVRQSIPTSKQRRLDIYSPPNMR